MAAEPRAKPTILCVDDEPRILEGLALQLRRRFDLKTATSGAAGLEILESAPSLAVVVSDMRMPGMDGATFLARARRAAPDCVRLLLTGQADIDAAIAAVNEGQIFRFLTKPCPPDRLLTALDAAVEQHRLVTSERVLLTQTLRGSVRMLTDVMALASPSAFGRATRVKDLGVELAKAAGEESVWAIEIAAMLSQIGCVTLPEETAERLYHGRPLSPEEQVLADRLPAVAERLLTHIPRLELVRACLVGQSKRFDGAGGAPGDAKGEALPLGARALKIAHDYDVAVGRGLSALSAVEALSARTGVYDPKLLALFAKLRVEDRGPTDVREIPLSAVTAGMRFAEDVKTAAGLLLLPRGYEVTEGLIDRIRNFSVKGNVRVYTSIAKV